MKGIIIAIAGVLSAVYLANIGAGIVEIIPDNIPLAGNLDEAAATALLIYCLSYFGIKLPSARRK